MNDRHPDDATMMAWVSGALGDAECAAFEHHVIDLGCEPCAARLEQHARIEVAMHEAADHMRGQKRRPASRRSTPAGLALAASLVLGLGLPGRWLTFDGVAEASTSAASVDATLLLDAPACPVTHDASEEPCDDEPLASFELEGALAMSMPEPDDGASSGPTCEDVFEGADGGSCGDDELFNG